MKTDIKKQSCTKKRAMNGVVSEKFRTFVQTNHNIDVSMRLRYILFSVLTLLAVVPATAGMISRTGL